MFELLFKESNLLILNFFLKEKLKFKLLNKILKIKTEDRSLLHDSFQSQGEDIFMAGRLHYYGLYPQHLCNQMDHY